ncbi:neurofascin-like [Littorina saxatilis]|uniref:neurofascin-like n=1 Tax=Littorina saxatilis TaxID=31220 RepID=UPI0038B65B81
MPGKPKFTTATEQVTLRENQSVALTCGAQSFPPATVTWGPRDTLRDGRFQIRGHDLVISDTKLSDNGQITCSATNALGTSEKIFDIHVLQHLIVAAQPTNITVTEGQHLQLECRFENKPPPAITWYHVAPNGTRTEVTSGVVQIGGHSVLERARTQVTDKGTYVCEGTNGVETTSLLEIVEVLSKPYITESSGPTVVARAGSDVVLRCHSDAHPTPVVHWTHNRNDSHVYEDLNGHLHLMDVRKVDAGQYTCIATNALGQDSKNIQVQVEVPPLANVQPQFSPLKATLFFDCQVTGDPPIKVTWLKEGLPLDVANQARYVVLPDQGTGSHRLLVTGATEADVGRYDCQTSNTFGTHLDTAYVYKDEKAVTCDDTFSICSLTICG